MDSVDEVGPVGGAGELSAAGQTGVGVGDVAVAGGELGDDDEIDLIIAYVREEQEARGLEPYPPG
ncbi:MAG: hypothetical protein ACSLFP_16075 [Acidimicrobiales bacterium]